ncbi:ankyrin repeat-containing protein ITN1-like [Corylus avellana]|uniref:ankyrin repeat-containing protein ITN1-like n=1 Tax=Corylus avellana TaxID=13451 RepID=UPI00286D6200|nr:ankyrin repeat-containing protein ITN1-like [Corylus avellana]
MKNYSVRSSSFDIRLSNQFTCLNPSGDARRNKSANPLRVRNGDGMKKLEQGGHSSKPSIPKNHQEEKPRRNINQHPDTAHDQKSKRPATAAKIGNVEFLIILVRSFPDLLCQVDESYGSLFHIAITYRQESVFNLIYEIGVMTENITTYIDKDGNNMLHFAAKLGPSDQLNTLSIAAVQMQHELLWYNKVGKIVPPSYVNMKNSNGETPLDIFEREHKYLQEKGEKWMKQTANNCILVATLIATVVFAAAFTVPGGNDQITEKPILLKSNWFTIFFISDAIAMVFSSTSILVFMSILTSRYREEDFVKIIPLLLLFGLGVLFVSIAGDGSSIQCNLLFGILH